MSAREQLNRLADAFVEDIMNLSDEEILAEMREDGHDPEQVAAEGRALFDRTVSQLHAKGWIISITAFRAILLDLKHQDITIRELRRLLLINRSAVKDTIGTPQEIAVRINGLECGGDKVAR